MQTGTAKLGRRSTAARAARLGPLALMGVLLGSCADPSVVQVTAEPPGPNCAHGGTRIQVGTEPPQFACNGGDGESVTVTAEAPGENCAEGGLLIQSQDGAEAYVCNGASPTGVDAAPLPAGEDCENGGIVLNVGPVTTYVCNGADGAPGSNGNAPAVTLEPAGAECPTGGVLIQIEGAEPAVVCNGAEPTVTVLLEAPGESCTDGGVRIQVGSQAPSYVCNGLSAPSCHVGEIVVDQTNPVATGNTGSLRTGTFTQTFMPETSGFLTAIELALYACVPDGEFVLRVFDGDTLVGSARLPVADAPCRGSFAWGSLDHVAGSSFDLRQDCIYVVADHTYRFELSADGLLSDVCTNGMCLNDVETIWEGPCLYPDDCDANLEAALTYMNEYERGALTSGAGVGVDLVFKTFVRLRPSSGL